ncbi:MAG TPA: aspartyl protease family protein, partial [Myxococcota bacterium]|nr:aspartyl protease family protein [Myxococcota bacterium]
AKGTAADWLFSFGPTLQVIVGLHPAAAPAGEAAVAPVERTVFALIDTGATLTCIDDALARDLGLPVIDKQVSSGIGGKTELDVYAANIKIPSLGFGQYGRFAGAKLKEGDQRHEIILGRSLLRDLIMIYDGRTGKVQLVV